MSDLLRYVLTAFGFRFVVLIYYSGGRAVRRIRFCGGRPFARVYGLVPESNCWLNDGGSVDGPSYIDGWEPYEPFAPKRWPIPSGATK